MCTGIARPYSLCSLTRKVFFAMNMLGQANQLLKRTTFQFESDYVLRLDDNKPHLYLLIRHFVFSGFWLSTILVSFRIRIIFKNGLLWKCIAGKVQNTTN